MPTVASLIGLAAALLGCDSTDRRARLEAAGAELGLAFHAELQPAAVAAIGAMPSLQGRSRHFFVRALESPELLVFDWVRRDGRLKDRDRETRTVIAIRAPGRELPPLVWTERGRIERMERRQLGEPIEFDGARSFSDDYEVFGFDREGLRALFDLDVRERLALPFGLQVEGAGQWWIGYRPGRTIPASELASAIEEMRAVVLPFARATGS